MKTIKFDKIKEKIQDCQDLWLIGERKWTLKANLEILNAETQKQTPEKTGIFLTDKIDFSNLENYKDCTHLIFFNNSEQFQFIAKSNECSDYICHKSEIEYKGDNKLELKNVVERENKNYKDNFRFKFAEKLGAIHQLNKGDKIKAVVYSDNSEWRLSHE